MTAYDEERLAALLRSLPPAPAGWVEAAQQLAAARTVTGSIAERAHADTAAGAQWVALLADNVATDRAITTVVARRQVLEALNAEQPTAELRLELMQSREGRLEERAAISLGWSKRELERLLQRATTEELLLTFDREQLAQAIAEVEAHSLPRQPLAVAVSAAGGPAEGDVCRGAALAIVSAAFTTRRS